MKTRYCLAVVLAWTMAVGAWHSVLADGPQDELFQHSNRQVGLVSNSIACLAVQAGTSTNASATVRLEWEGRVDEAFLSLAVAGSEGEHSIYINGHFVGRTPARPGGQPCQPGASVPSHLATDFMPIPPEVLTSGENVITLTNDANSDDGWTAANMYLEIHGALSLPMETSIQGTLLTPSDLQVTAVTTGSVSLISSYDGTLHTVWYQVPMSYTGSVSVPLVVRAHGWGGTGESMLEGSFADEANERGWLLVAPNTHGTYYLDGKRSMAWPGAQHDIIDAVEYMQANYEVDPARIYMIGGSMGGQTTTMMVVKYPDIFAAAAAWKPFTDLTDWYNTELASNSGMQWHIRNETGGTPANVPFEYQRRSSMLMPQNGRYIPLKIWHDEDDTFVAIYHSRDFRDAVNSSSPARPVELIEVASAEHDCPDDPVGQHCYEPPTDEVFNFLGGFTLSTEPPLSLTIRTDETKPYYWLNIAQTGGDHWSDVEVSYSLTNQTVTATISDTKPLTLAFNLGSMPITGRANISRSGMGLPATTYLINGGGNYSLANYSSGYLTTTLSSTGQFSLTISAIELEVSANPNTNSEGEAITSTITAVAQDQLDNAVPDNTTILFSTSRGTFLGSGSSTYATIISGGQGQATVLLTTDGSAQITASIETVTASTSIFDNVPIYLPLLLKNN